MENEGILISGTVSGRVKRLIGEKQTELVTYKIVAGGKEYYIKDWEPCGKYYKVGEKIISPVTVKIYHKNGQSSLDYSILRKNSMFGEAF